MSTKIKPSGNGVKGHKVLFLSKRKLNYKHCGIVTSSRVACLRHSSRNGKMYPPHEAGKRHQGCESRVECVRALKGGGEQAKADILYSHYDSLQRYALRAFGVITSESTNRSSLKEKWLYQNTV